MVISTLCRGLYINKTINLLNETGLEITISLDIPGHSEFSTQQKVVISEGCFYENDDIEDTIVGPIEWMVSQATIRAMKSIIKSIENKGDEKW